MTDFYRMMGVKFYIPNDFLFYAGDLAVSVFFLIRGSLEVRPIQRPSFKRVVYTSYRLSLC